MSEIDKQIELMKLQLELAKLQQDSKKKATTRNADWTQTHTPTQTFKAWCIEIGSAIEAHDVVSFSTSFEYLLEYFRVHYRKLDEEDRPIVFIEKAFWIFNEKREWSKIPKEEICEGIFRRLYNRMLKRMFVMFEEHDVNWARNEKYNHKFVMIMNDVLEYDKMDEAFQNLTFRILPIVDVKDF